jgi:hypothetical protein
LCSTGSPSGRSGVRGVGLCPQAGASPFGERPGNNVALTGVQGNMDETRSTEVKIRMRPSLKAAIEKAAKHDGRSASNWIERVIEEAIRQHPSAQKNNSLKRRPR